MTNLTHLKKLKLPYLLPANNYVRMVRKELGGAMAQTHLAIVKNERGVDMRAYVKHFPKYSPRGLFNEYVGYTVMSALGMPQPESAIINAPIPSTNLSGMAYVSFQPMPISEGTPKEIYNLSKLNQCKSLVERLIACTMFPSMIAADQVCMNQDRNMGNLVFTSKKGFVLIDHSEILGGSNSDISSLLKTTEKVESIPLLMCEQFSPLTDRTKSALCGAADVVAEMMWKEYVSLCTELNADEQIEVQIALEAIWWRSLELSDWFKNEMGVLA